MNEKTELDERFDRYDNLITVIVRDLQGVLLHDKYIGINNFDETNDEHLLILHLADIAALSWGDKCYLHARLGSWWKMRKKYKTLHWDWNNKHMNFKVNAYLDSLHLFTQNDFPRGIGEIYQAYYVKGIEE